MIKRKKNWDQEGDSWIKAQALGPEFRFSVPM